MPPIPSPRPIHLPLPIAADPNTPPNALPVNSQGNPVKWGYPELRLRPEAPIARTINTLQRDTGLPYATCQYALSNRTGPGLSAYTLAAIAYAYNLSLDQVAYIELVGEHLPDKQQQQKREHYFDRLRSPLPADHPYYSSSQSGTTRTQIAQTAQTTHNTPGKSGTAFQGKSGTIFPTGFKTPADRMRDATEQAHRNWDENLKRVRDYTPTTVPQPDDLDPRKHAYLPNPYQSNPGRNDQNDANPDRIRERAAWLYRELICNSVHGYASTPNRPFNDYQVSPPLRLNQALQDQSNIRHKTEASDKFRELIRARIRYETGRVHEWIKADPPKDVRDRYNQIQDDLMKRGWGGVSPSPWAVPTDQPQPADQLDTDTDTSTEIDSTPTHPTPTQPGRYVDWEAEEAELARKREQEDREALARIRGEAPPTPEQLAQMGYPPDADQPADADGHRRVKGKSGKNKGGKNKAKTKNQMAI